MFDIVTVIGLFVGVMMITTVCAVFLRNQTFGVGGSALSMLGTILIGMSVWGNISVSVGADGGITAELTQIRQKVSEISTHNQKIDQSVSEIRVEVKQTRDNIRSLQTDIANFQASSDLAPDGIFGPATDARLREHLRKIRATPDHESTIEMVQKMTGKSRLEAENYIRDATK